MLTDLMRRGVPRLHVIVDVVPGSNPGRLLDAVLVAGAPLVQLRAKGLADREHYGLATAVVERCHAAGVVCIVNDRVDIALAAGADGVHVGGDDLPVRSARRLLDQGRPGLLLGATARDPETAWDGVAAGADYLGVGPCYATASKDGLPVPGGPQRIAVVADAVDVPIIAIAGVTTDRVAEVRAAGAHGVAVIGAVSRADDPRRAVADLLEALEQSS